MRWFLLTLCLASSTLAWNCGIGKVSNLLSFAIAFPSQDLTAVNRCCQEHDDLIESCSRDEADHSFCKCLGNSEHWYVRTVVKPLFCISVNLYTKFNDWYNGNTVYLVNDCFHPKKFGYRNDW
ncbi:unnamed protein product [Caenorhabditis auriculariae]|uniref:Domain of unknown function DB domain-containing protein n=1 Tax=Caenorhabditis auriculariae TaxID=2777116 RepID=A0A8S1HCX7_9PELO|nr:unnamed protein product [Caenorhabditis auriculariae]